MILDIQEAEIRRIEVQSQPQQIVKRLYFEKTHNKKRGLALSSNHSTKGGGENYKPYKVLIKCFRKLMFMANIQNPRTRKKEKLASNKT
jgi:hypothetical protein